MSSKHPHLSERLLAMIDAVTDLMSVALDVPQLANAIAQNAGDLDGGTGAAVGVYASGDLDVVATADRSVFDRRDRFAHLLQSDTILEGKLTAYVADALDDARCNADAARQLSVRSLIAAPLAARGERVGVLWIYSREPNAFAAEDPELISRFARIVGPILDLSMQFNTKLYESRTDELTGLQNRRAFDERLRRRTGELERYGTRFTLVLADLDDFKAINDTYGHAAGDRVLKTVAHAVRRHVRVSDEVFRVGGDEFAILFAAIGGEAANALMRRVNAQLRERPRAHGVSISYGVAEARPGEPPASLLDRADKALYGAKHARTS